MQHRLFATSQRPSLSCTPSTTCIMQPPLHCGYPLGSSPQRCRLQLAELVDLPHLGEEVGEEVGVVLDRRRLSARWRRLRPTLAGHDTQSKGLRCLVHCSCVIVGLARVFSSRRSLEIGDLAQRSPSTGLSADSTSGLQTVQPHGVITKYSVVHVVMGEVFFSQPSIPTCTSVCLRTPL